MSNPPTPTAPHTRGANHATETSPKLKNATNFGINELIRRDNVARDINNQFHRIYPTLYEDTDGEPSLTTLETPEDPSKLCPSRAELIESLPPASKDAFANIVPQNVMAENPGNYPTVEDPTVEDPTAEDPSDTESQSSYENDRDIRASYIGASVPYHHYLVQLYLLDVYIPLSLFTNDNLSALMRDSDTLPLRLHNAFGLGKPFLILDTEAAEAKYGREDNLSYELWGEAVYNYLAFLCWLDEEQDEPEDFKRWQAHFHFFQTQDDFAENFSAGLYLDICIRKEFNVFPFSFPPDYYEREYGRAKVEYPVNPTNEE